MNLIKDNIKQILGQKTKGLLKDIKEIQNHIENIHAKKKQIELSFKKNKQKEEAQKLKNELKSLNPILKNIKNYKKILKIYQFEYKKLKLKIHRLEGQSADHWIKKNKLLLQKEFRDKIALLVKIYQDSLEKTFLLKQKCLDLVEKKGGFYPEIEKIIQNINLYIDEVKNKIEQKGADLQKLNRGFINNMKEIIKKYAATDVEKIYMEKIDLLGKFKVFEKNIHD